MRRRAFVKLGLAGTAASAIPANQLFGQSRSKTGSFSRSANSFQLNYAPHLGMFRNHAGSDPVDQLNFMADEGFTAFEDNGMRSREVSVQNAMAQTMTNRGIHMGVFVAHKIYWNEPNLASGDLDWREEFLSFIRQSVDVARRVNATWMTVVPGFVALRKDAGYQTANVVESLKQACELLEPHELVMVLEPLNPHDHPGLFLTKISQAYEICKAVASPACKILDDLYHQQITEGNLIPNIDTAYDEIAYFQIGDNPGRNEPTTGEINFNNVFKHIYDKGYSGILGMEHGNSQSGTAGERAVIDAYREVDSF